MALNIREIKNKQKSISNIGQIARAMELVSVTKMRRSQRVALASRPYAKAAFTILKDIKQTTSASKSYFFGIKELNGARNFAKNKKRTAVLLITTDKGLCGGLNTNVFRKAENLITDLISDVPKTDYPIIDFVIIGKKGEEWCARKKFNIIKSFNNFGDYIEFTETAPVAEFIINLFKNGGYEKIFAVYTNFISALKQFATAREILPLNENILQEIIKGMIPQSGKFSEAFGKPQDEGGAAQEINFEYMFEPKAEEILDGILYSLVETEIYYIILENNASEHSARRMAMKNAYENADEMKRELNLKHNKARQAGITQELTEIASAANI